jgi:predicted metal-dependent phosphoesterase TrpH
MPTGVENVLKAFNHILTNTGKAYVPTMNFESPTVIAGKIFT